MHDCPEEIEQLAAEMEPYYSQMKQLAADSEAENVMLGGNYDDSITHPRFFEKHIFPVLTRLCCRAACQGEVLDDSYRRREPAAHTAISRAGFDIADSLCPAPMTRMSLAEIRAALADYITIWGGIPSVLLCRHSCRDSDFREWIENLIERYGHVSRFVLGVSDMVTADVDWDRVEYITEKVAKL